MLDGFSNSHRIDATANFFRLAGRLFFLREILARVMRARNRRSVHVPVTNEKQLELNPYLKARGESQLRAKHAFERSAGWRFGFVFGVMVILVGYVLDAVELFQAHAEFWWLHLALALVTILPLAILAGGISGYVNWILKLGVWALFGISAGWCAIHIPFDGAGMAAQWFDPNLRSVAYLPIPKGAADSMGMLMTLGVCLGLVVGLAQTLVVGWAWEHSTTDFQITPRGWLVFFASAPLAIVYGLMFDGASQVPLRVPMRSVNAIVQSGLNDPQGLDHAKMEVHRALTYLVGQRWRASFTPDYVLHLAASEPQVKGETYVDLSFSNGNLLRCRITTYGEFSGGCIDLKQTYANYISEFLRRGTFDCRDCKNEIAPQAADWQKQNARTLTGGDVTQMQHGAGSSVNVRVTTADNTQIECLFTGANPVIIARCQ